MELNQADLRRAAARFASGVTVVAATDAETGQPRGMTVSAFLFLSYAPPLVLVSLASGTPTLAAVLRRKTFGISILCVDQQRISDRFAGDEEGRFEQVGHHVEPSGAVLIHGALATLECALGQQLTLGDHSVLVGRVIAANFREGRPLLYYRGRYGSFHSLTEAKAAPWPADDSLASWGI